LKLSLYAPSKLFRELLLLKGFIRTDKRTAMANLFMVYQTFKNSSTQHIAHIEF